MGATMHRPQAQHRTRLTEYVISGRESMNGIPQIQSQWRPIGQQKRKASPPIGRALGRVTDGLASPEETMLQRHTKNAPKNANFWTAFLTISN